MELKFFNQNPFEVNIDGKWEETHFKGPSEIVAFLGINFDVTQEGGCETNDPTHFLWWPTENHKNWSNPKSRDGSTIYESSLNGVNHFKHAQGIINNRHTQRAVFWRGSINEPYQFVGVFDLEDNPPQKDIMMLTWKLVSNTWVYRKQ